MADPYQDGKPRYSTEITDNYYFKYREPIQRGKFQALFYGSDSDLLYRTKRGMLTGGVVGLCVAVAVSAKRNIGFSKIVEGSFKHGLPWVIVGTTYGVGTGLAANFRNKDGPFNHAVGGYAAGTVLGSWYKSAKMGVTTGLVFAVLGIAYKTVVDDDMLTRGFMGKRRLPTSYRDGWFIDRPDPEGVRDENNDASFKVNRL